MCRNSHSATSDPDGEAGFTLAELLVALALLTVVLGFALGGIRFGTRAFEATHAVDQSAELGAVRTTLRACLQAASPLSAFDAQGRARPEFQGAAVRLLLACPLRDGLTRLDLYRAETGDLIATTTPYLRATKPDDDDPPAETHRLVGGVASISLRYFGDAGDGKGMVWHEAWMQPSRLPQLVAIDVRFPTSDRRVWPELVAAIKAAPAGPVTYTTAP